MKRARTGRATREYTCLSLKEGLRSVFGIAVEDDDPHTHPVLMCRSCHNTIMKERTAFTPFQWKAHEAETCSVSKTNNVLHKYKYDKNLGM